MKSAGIDSFSFNFGGTTIPGFQVFLLRRNVIGIVNVKPAVEGHVLVCSRRSDVSRLKSLNEAETLDLWYSAMEVQKTMEEIYKVPFINLNDANDYILIHLENFYLHTSRRT